MPLTICIKDISEYLDAFPTAIDKDTFYQCIFLIDDIILSDFYEKNKPKGSSKSKNNIKGGGKQIPL